MWRTFRDVRPSLPSHSCRRITRPTVRAGSASTRKQLLGEYTPVATQLAATKLWADRTPKKGAKKGKARAPVSGDRSRVNIVSEPLCDDILQYVGPTLQRHVGCDLLDIHPGAGVWSRKLHHVLRPRSHVLMEPDQNLYEPFLRPLTSQPGVKLLPESGFLWTGLQRAMDHLEHQTEQPRSPSIIPQRNDTLLVTANLSLYPKRRFNTFDSVATLVLYQLLTSVRFGSLCQKYGLVRMLLWVNDEDKRPFLPRCMQQRKKSALQAELACEWLAEVAGKDPAGEVKKPHVRDHGIDLDSSRRALASARALGMGDPVPGRRLAITEEVMGAAGQSGAETASMDSAQSPQASRISRPYMAELEALNEKFENGLLPAQSAEWKRRIKLKYQVEGHDREVRRADELARELDELRTLRLARDLSPDATKELKKREAAFAAAVQSLSKNCHIMFRLLRDNAHLYRQNPPVLLWDRRPWEPLRVDAKEFFPNVESALLDIQPKPMHPLLRDVGPDSDHAGDILDLIQRSLLTRSLEPLGKSLEKLWPGAKEGVLDHCESLKDPAQGGVPETGSGELCPRVLNERQWMEILEKFMQWPFRPSYGELVGRHGEDGLGDMMESSNGEATG